MSREAVDDYLFFDQRNSKQQKMSEMDQDGMTDLNMSGISSGSSGSSNSRTTLPWPQFEKRARTTPYVRKAGKLSAKERVAAIRSITNPREKAKAIRENQDYWDNVKFKGNRKFGVDYKTYGRMYMPRGTAAGLELHGNTWAEASELQRSNRNADGWTGRGAYNMGRAFRNTISDMRPYARKAYNTYQDVKPLLSAAGAIGMGSYSMPGIYGSSSGNLGMIPISQANSLINNMVPSRSLSSVGDETNSIVISNAEYLGDIIPSSSQFLSLYNLAINPGLASTFPWLSQLAQFYEEYSFEQLSFTFKSMTNEGATSASGSVIMATQYNPTNAAFTTKQQMENYDYAHSCKVTQNMAHGVECDPSKTGQNAVEYIRTGTLASNQDIKTYDLGIFQLAVNGTTASGNVGELWVNYKVKLSKTKMVTPGTVSRNINAFAEWSLVPVAANLLATPVKVADNTATQTISGSVSTPDSNTGFVVGTNTLTFPNTITSGKYLVSLSAVMSTAATTAVSVAVSGGVLTAKAVHTGGETVNASVQYQLDVNTNSSSPVVLTFSGGASLVSSSGRLIVSQLFSSV